MLTLLITGKPASHGNSVVCDLNLQKASACVVAAAAPRTVQHNVWKSDATCMMQLLWTSTQAVHCSQLCVDSGSKQLEITIFAWKRSSVCDQESKHCNNYQSRTASARLNRKQPLGWYLGPCSMDIARWMMVLRRCPHSKQPSHAQPEDNQYSSGCFKLLKLHKGGHHAYSHANQQPELPLIPKRTV